MIPLKRFGLACALVVAGTFQLHATTPLTLGATYAGSISVPGQTNVFTFTGAAGQRLFFDALTSDFNLRINVSLISPGGTVVYGRVNQASEGGPLVLPEPGPYSLVIDADGSTTGNYQFRLLDFSAAPSLPIGTPLIDQLSSPLTCNLYQFKGTHGQRISLQVISNSTSQVQWQLVTPANVIIPQNQALGTNTLPIDGNYSLMVIGTAAGTSPLVFQLLATDMSDSPAVASGFGTTHSGTIGADQTNSFTYNAPAGLPVYFDSLDASGRNLVVDLVDPSGKPVFSISEFSDSGPYVLPRSGSYTLSVRGPGGASGNYYFRLLDLSTSPALSLSSSFSNTLSLPYQTDVYQFTGTAGQRLFYDSTVPSALTAQVQLLGPDGLYLVNGNLSYDASLPVSLQFPGIYYLFVQSGVSTAPAYQFKLWDVGTQPPLPLNTDLTGTLAPNSSLIYQLAGTNGEKLYFYGKSVSAGGAYCYLFDGRNQQVIGGSANLGGDFEVALPYNSAYTLIMFGPNNSITYSNQVSTFAYTTNVLTLGTSVSNNIVNPGDQVVYTFTGTAGQRVYYDALNATYPSINVAVVSPTGVSLYGPANVSSDTSAPLILPETGTYQLVFNGDGHTTGPISFQVLDMATQPTLPLNTDLIAGLPANASQVYQFAGTTGEHLYFNSKAVSAGGASWTLFGPNNAYVGAAPLGGDFEPQLLSSGTYVLVISGGATAVTYSNQVNTFTFTTNALTLGGAITNSLTRPGDQFFYTFNATAGQRFYFDSFIANYLSINFTLSSPAGVVLTPRNVSSDFGPFTLPQTGAYTLQIDGDSDAVGQFAFQLLDIGAQPALPLNTDLVGSLAPNTSLVYQLAGTAGEALYFNTKSSVGNGANWTLYGPNDAYVNSANLPNDFEQTLAFAGNYVLVFAAANNPLTYSNQVNTFAYSTNALTPGTGINTALVHPGDQLYYTFTGTAGQRIYYDARVTNSALSATATLYSPAGATIFSVSSISDSGPYTLTQNGTYTLVQDGSSDTTGVLAFNLLDLAGATSINVGDPLNDSLTDQTQTRLYRFNGTKGQRLNLQSVSASGNQALWQLLGPADQPIGSEPYITASIGTVVLPATTTYTLAVIGYGFAASPVNYQLSLADVTDSPVAASGFGTVNSGNVAANGTNSYTYTASAGTPVFFDSQDASGQSLFVELLAPDGTAVFTVGETADSGPYILPRSGTYTLNVRGYNGASGNYSFRLLDLSASPSLSLNTSITAALNNPYQTEIYQLTSSAGQVFFYDALTNDVNNPSVSAQMLNPRWQAVGPNNGNFAVDRGPFAVQYAGTCYLLLLNAKNTVGLYSFRLLDVVTQPVLPVNAAVTNTLDVYPAQIYRYTGTAGKRLYLRGQPTNPSGSWYFYDPNNAIVAGGSAGLTGDLEVTLPSNGNYTLLLTSSASTAGTEIFQVNDFSFVTNSYTVGSRVVDNITRPGERHFYTFTGTLGQRLIYDALTNDPLDGSTITAQLLNPQGISEGPIGGRFSIDRGPFSLQQSGTYTLVFDANGSGSGTFAFQLLDVSTQPALPINSPVSTTLDVFPSLVYRYTGTGGQQLFFHAQPGNPSGYWTLYDPNNSGVSAGSAGLTGDIEVSLPVSGTYTLVLSSYGPSAGTEAFQVDDFSYFTNAYTIGSPLVNDIKRPGERRLYTFTGTVGQRLIYNALTNDPPNNSVITAQLLNPDGVAEGPIGGRFSNNRGPFTLQKSGTYTLVVDGNGSSVGTFAFQFLDVSAQPTLVVSSGVTNTIGVFPLEVYRYSGAAGQRLYFRGFANNPSGNWALYDPNDVSLGSAALANDFEVTLPIAGTYVLVLWNYTTSPATEIFTVNPFNNGENLLVNRAPVLNHIGNQILGAGIIVNFTAQASDPDGNVLTFSLDPGSPAGASINSATGLFAWNPPIAGSSSVTPVTVRVSDNGNPSLSTAETLLIEVIAGPTMYTIQRLGPVANVYWYSAPGKRYRLQYKNDIFDPIWQLVGADFTATALISVQPDSVGTNSHRFYRVQDLDPLP